MINEENFEEVLVEICDKIFIYIAKQVDPILMNKSVPHEVKSALLGSIGGTLMMRVCKVIVDNDMSLPYETFIDELFNKIREEINSYVKSRMQ